MSALLRLYPRAWRERYGDELLALLEAEPASIRDRVDLIRGALDARQHPELIAGSAPIRRVEPVSRGLAAAAMGAGVVWLLYVAAAALVSGDWATFGPSLQGVGQFALMLGTILMFAAAIGPHLQPVARRVITWAIAVGVLWAAALSTPWPVGVYLLFSVLALVAATLLLLASFRAGLGWLSASALIAFGAVLPLVLVLREVSSSQFLVLGWDPDLPVLMLPLGVAWLLIGVVMLGHRRSPGETTVAA